MVVDPSDWPWIQTVPTLVVVTLVKVMELTPPTMVPATVALLETSAMTGPFEVTVTLMGDVGATDRVMPTSGFSMLTPVTTLPTLMPGAVTVAVTCWYCDGVLKAPGSPDAGGAPRLTVVVPAAAGTKFVVAEVASPLNETGLVGDVPDSAVRAGDREVEWPDARIELAVAV